MSNQERILSLCRQANCIGSKETCAICKNLSTQGKDGHWVLSPLGVICLDCFDLEILAGTTVINGGKESGE